MEGKEKETGLSPEAPLEISIREVPDTGKTSKKAGKRDHAARRDALRENTKKRQDELRELREQKRIQEAEMRAAEEAAKKAAREAKKQAAEVLPGSLEPASELTAEIPLENDAERLSETAAETYTEKPAEQTIIDEEPAEPEKGTEEPGLPVLEIDEEASEGPKKPKKKRLVTALIVTGIVLVSLIVAGVLAAFGIFNYFYNQSNYIAEGETYIPTAPPTEEDQETTTAEPIKEGVNYSLLGTTESTTETSTEEESTTEPSINRTGVYNCLLIGIDVGSGNGNSDSMILCSINYDLHKIFLTTLMRDSQVEIPDYGTRKLNSACAIGGPTLLVDTLEQYFGFEIDNFAMIDFEGMKAVINALGGVDLYITVEEAAFMLIQMDEDQMVHLDGRLALRHARDRSSGGSDFGRTARQRNVLMAIVKKARRGDIGDIVEAAKAILPYITHDMSRRDLAEIMRELPALIKWDFVQQRIPYEGLFVYANENLVMDVPATMERWHAVVYDGAVYDDTILEESTEAASEEETEPSGESAEDESRDPEESAGPGDETIAEEPDLIPDDLLKLPDGIYQITCRPDQYLNPIPEDFNYNNLITLTVWKDVKNMEELDALLAFEATGERAIGRQLAIYGSDYYIGSGRQNRFWKLEKWDGTLLEP